MGWLIVLSLRAVGPGSMTDREWFGDRRQKCRVHTSRQRCGCRYCGLHLTRGHRQTQSSSTRLHLYPLEPVTQWWWRNLDKSRPHVCACVRMLRHRYDSQLVVHSGKQVYESRKTDWKPVDKIYVSLYIIFSHHRIFDYSLITSWV